MLCMHARPHRRKGPWGTRGNGDISETRFILFKTILSAAIWFLSQCKIDITGLEPAFQDRSS